jgi:hypothetical protein
MVPYYQSQQQRQIVRFEGLDLASVQRWEITASTRAISPDSILQFDHTQFHIASQSRLGAFYLVDLNLSTCDCKDFPRIWFCKHITTIHLHFPHLCFEESDPIIPSEISPAPNQHKGNPNPDPHPRSAPALEETLQLLTLTQEINALNSLSQNLASKKISQSSHTEVLEAIWSAKYSLTLAIASTEGTSTLPNIEYIAPNQKSGWGETATCMGIKCACTPKPKQKCLPKERGMTAWAIGIANRKRHHTYSDPYAGGERLGKWAKPNALSAEANRHAHVCVPPFAMAPAVTSTSHAPTAMAVVPPPSPSAPDLVHMHL